MRWTARALATPSADTDTCLSIFFEGQPAAKYLFNCGENTFKSIQQRKYGITKFKAVFLTSIGNDTSSGLPGLLMTFADSGSRELTVAGPPGLNHMLATTRSYAMRDALRLNRIECNPVPSSEPPLIFKDDNLSVFAVPCHPSPAAAESQQTSSSEALSFGSPITERITEQLFSGGTVTSEGFVRNVPFDWGLHRTPLPPVPRAATHVSYIGLGRAVRGKFDAKRATELGIMGPARALLTRGQSVLSKDGVTMVTPDMCLGPSTPPSAFMIIDCPNPSYVQDIVSSNSLNFYKHFPEARLNFILHKTGPGVLEDARYVEWMKSFDDKTEHFIAQHDCCADPVTFTSSANLLLGLSELDSEMFVFPTPNPARRLLSTIPNLPENAQPLQLDHLIGMHPASPAKVSPTAGSSDEFTPALIAKLAGKSNARISPDLRKLFEQIQAEVGAEEILRKKRTGDEVIITTLGTGSALPSKYRNVLSTLVQIPGWGSVLLDAGEGTWGQIARRFGTQVLEEDGSPAESPANSILRDIRCIFISHLHADHHVGLSKILALRHRLNPSPEQPLFLVAGQETIDYLTEYHNLEDLGLETIRIIENGDVANPPSPEEWRIAKRSTTTDLDRRRQSSLDARQQLISELGFTSLETVGVIHRGPCYGIVIRHKDGWSLAFSGDTVPSENLVQAGKDVTVLIHEASLSNDEVELANAKQHSTIGQAIDVGKRMGAKNIILTHFSQRYPKIPSLAAAAPTISDDASSSTITTKEHDSSSTNQPSLDIPIESITVPEPPVAIAFDCVSIPIGSIWKMSRYTPALERVFVELADVGDDEETSLRATAMGIPAESLDVPILPSSSRAADKTARKAQGEHSIVGQEKQPAKRQKISNNRSRAVG